MFCKDFSLGALFHGFHSSFTINCTVTQGQVIFVCFSQYFNQTAKDILNVECEIVIVIINLLLY